jgi:translation elongation factor EF-1beta
LSLLAAEQLIRQVNKVRELQEMEKKYQELQEEKIAIGLQKMALEQQQSDEKIIA